MQSHVLTIIGAAEIDPAIVASIASEAAALAGAMFGVAPTRRTLSPGRAEEVYVTPTADANANDFVEAAREVAGDAPVDLAVLSNVYRRKKLLIADMDSTIIGQECLDELADFAGLKAEISAVTERAMRGELQFEEALRARVAKLKGLAADALDRTYAERISLTTGAAALTGTMRAHGAMTILASGGFTFFTGRVAAASGFERNVANVIEISDGLLTGTVREPIFGREGKAETMRASCAELGLSPDDALAVGDGANDLGMIEAAGLGVAFRAKPAVALAADARVDNGDLTSLLYLQGYTDEEIVEW